MQYSYTVTKKGPTDDRQRLEALRLATGCVGIPPLLHRIVSRDDVIRHLTPERLRAYDGIAICSLDDSLFHEYIEYTCAGGERVEDDKQISAIKHLIREAGLSFMSPPRFYRFNDITEDVVIDSHTVLEDVPLVCVMNVDCIYTH